MLIDFKTYLTIAANRGTKLQYDRESLYLYATKDLAIILDSVAQDNRMHPNHKLWPHIGKLFIYSILEAGVDDVSFDNIYRMSFDYLANNDRYDKFSAIDCLEACILDSITFSRIDVKGVFEVFSHLGFRITDVRAYSDMVLRINERERLLIEESAAKDVDSE